MIDFNIPVEEEILYLANVLTEQQRKAMFARMRGGGGGSSGDGEKAAPVYSGTGSESGGGQNGPQYVGDDRQPENPNAKYKDYFDWFYNGQWKGGSGWVKYMSPMSMRENAKNPSVRLRDAIASEIQKGTYDNYKINGHVPSVDEVLQYAIVPGYDSIHNLSPSIKNREISDTPLLANAFHSDAQRRAVKNDILQRALYLANKELTDEQRKAIFAKNGGGGSGGGEKPLVYTMASPHGTISRSGGSQPTGPLTVTSISEIPQEKPNYRMGDLKLADGRIIPGDKIKDYLGAAYSEQSGVINAGLLSQEQKKQLGLVKDPLAGATAQAIMPGDMAAKTGQDPFARFSTTPTQQVKQDITGTTSTGGGGTSTPAGGGSTGAAAGGGGSAAPGDIGGAIGTIDVSGAGGGPTAAEIAAANLSAFQQALAHAHF